MWLYVLIAFGFSWTLWIPEALISQSIVQNELLTYLASLSNFGAWGPFVSAIVVTLSSQGKKGITKMLKQTFRVDFSKKWLLPSFLLFPVIIGLPLVVLRFIGQPLPELAALSNPLILPIVFIVVLLNMGPLQEEFGWRGVLQAHLQKKIFSFNS